MPNSLEKSGPKISTLSSLEGESHDWLAESITMCFGHFNIIHPGHIRYLRKAKEYGSVLMVAIEGDFVLTGAEQDRFFSQDSRAEALASLEFVDNVVILDTGKLASLFEVVQPEVLVLGREYERERLDQDRKGKVESAIKWMRARSRKIVYESGEIHYATEYFLRTDHYELLQERFKGFQKALEGQQVDFESVLSKIKQHNQREVLVIGDTILDRYIACDPVGMSNEAPVVVVKEIESKDFLGGAGIVAAHVAGLGLKCKYLSVVGNDRISDSVRAQLKKYQVDADLIIDSSRPTTLKIRYLVENQKLFRVSRLKDHWLSRELEDSLIEKVAAAIPGLSAIVLSDFVYGVLSPKMVAVIKKLSDRFGVPIYGDRQCSSQIGDVSKFREFDLICPTEREARIALNNQDDGLEQIANSLIQTTRSKNLILKLGSDGFIAYQIDSVNDVQYRQHFPALTVNPVDVTGAGDSLLATMAVGGACHLSIMESAALGCCVSALAVQTIGNQPIKISEIQRFLMTNAERFKQ